MIGKIKTTAVILSLAAAAVLSVSSARANEGASGQNEDGKGVVGSWSVGVTFEGAFLHNIVKSFTSDGSVLLAVPDGRVGHGSWAKAGREKFAVTFLIYVDDPATGKTFTQKFRETVQLGGANSYTSVFHFEEFDPAGHLDFKGDGTTKGSRILVEPL